MKRRDVLKTTGLALGYSLSAGTVAAIMNGCKAPTEPGWTPSAVDHKTIDLIAEVAETILPATDTPGAKDVLVHRFIDEVLIDTYGPKQKAHMMAGLKNLSDDLGGNFMKMSADDKLKAVIALEEKADKADQEMWTKYQAEEEAKKEEEPPRAGPMELSEPEYFRHYYKELKSLIVAGYFSSQQVGTEVLAYDPIPGGYDPCIDLAEGQKAWSF